jgi:hypothetical protein
MKWGKNYYLCRPPNENSGLMGRKPAIALNPQLHQKKGSVVQLVRMLPCHGRGRGFESRPVRSQRITIIVILFSFYTTLLLTS